MWGAGEEWQDVQFFDEYRPESQEVPSLPSVSACTAVTSCPAVTTWWQVFDKLFAHHASAMDFDVKAVRYLNLLTKVRPRCTLAQMSQAAEFAHTHVAAAPCRPARHSL